MWRIIEKIYEIILKSVELSYMNDQYVNEYNQRIPIMRGRL